MNKQTKLNRRAALGTGISAAAILAALPPGAYAAGDEVIKVGLIGCGGRGTGAASNVMHAAPGVVIHAIGDMFESQAKGAQRNLRNMADNEPKIKELGKAKASAWWQTTIADISKRRGEAAANDLRNRMNQERSK